MKLIDIFLLHYTIKYIIVACDDNDLYIKYSKQLESKLNYNVTKNHVDHESFIAIHILHKDTNIISHDSELFNFISENFLKKTESYNQYKLCFDYKDINECVLKTFFSTYYEVFIKKKSAEENSKMITSPNLLDKPLCESQACKYYIKLANYEIFDNFCTNCDDVELIYELTTSIACNSRKSNMFILVFTLGTDHRFIDDIKTILQILLRLKNNNEAIQQVIFNVKHKGNRKYKTFNRWCNNLDILNQIPNDEFFSSTEKNSFDQKKDYFVFYNNKKLFDIRFTYIDDLDHLTYLMQLKESNDTVYIQKYDTKNLIPIHIIDCALDFNISLKIIIFKYEPNKKKGHKMYEYLFFTQINHHYRIRFLFKYTYYENLKDVVNKLLHEKQFKLLNNLFINLDLA
ncbi:hypothetical protein COBT_000392 [Conglomerata obtusa]